MKHASVAITGLGAMSAAGADVAGTLESLGAGKRQIAASTPFATTIQCPTFQVNAELPVLPGYRNGSRTLRLAMGAVREALREAQLVEFSPEARVGVCLGTTVAAQLNNLPFYDCYRRTGNPPLEAVHEFLQANLGEAVANLLGVQGPRMTVVNAC